MSYPDPYQFHGHQSGARAGLAGQPTAAPPSNESRAMTDVEVTRHNAVHALEEWARQHNKNERANITTRSAEAAVDAIATYAHVLATSKPSHDVTDVDVDHGA